MLLIILRIGTSPVMGDEMLWCKFCRFWLVILGSVTVPTYNTTKGVSFASMSDYLLDDVSVFVCMVVASRHECIVFGYVKFRLCSCCHTLCSIGFRRFVSHRINGYCVQYTFFVGGSCVLLLANNAEWSCRRRLKLAVTFLR